MQKRIKNNPNLTIVIPAKYEQENIIATLEEIRQKVKTPSTIIVVNDSHHDDPTGEIVKAYARRRKNIQVITRRRKKLSTFASALQAAFIIIPDGVVIPVMADGCDRVMDIDIMYQKMLEGWDIVCASRYMPKGKKHGGPVLQSFFSWFVCKTIHMLTNIPTDDVSNTFKMYRKKIFETVIINQKSGVELSMSMTLQAYFHGARITQIPTVWHGRTLGYSKFKFLERTPRYLSIYLSAIRSVIKKGK